MNLKAHYKAESFYRFMGYQLVEVPWAVTPQYAMIAKPDNKPLLPLFDSGQYLVASAEQSFASSQYLDSNEGKFVATTPCFRDEKCRETYHQRCFLKTELFVPAPLKPMAMIDDMIYDASHLMSELLHIKAERLKIVEVSDNQKDLYLNGIEVGSYGLREWNGWSWVYGTGLATPRLFQAAEHREQ